MPGTYTTATWTPLVGKPYRYEAFTPTPLADRLPKTWSREVVRLADQALESLATLPAEETLGGLSVHLGRAEAGGSSMIEGHYVGSRRLYEHEFDPDASIDDRALPVYNNWRLMDRVRSTPALSVEAMLDWHRHLMQHDSRAQPGEFRTEQNWIGGDIYGPRNATFIPPPPDQVLGLMGELVDYAETTADHPIVRAAALHTQFETIHPFTDGNGRVGRALIHWALRSAEPSVPPLALVWYGHGDRYFGGLDAWRIVRDPEPWVAYFASSLLEAIEAAHTLISALGDLRADWSAKVPTRAGSAARQLIEGLTTHPIVDAQSARFEYGISPSGFSRAGRRLVDHGVLVPTSLPRRRRGRPRKVYEARQVFEVLNDFIERYRSGAA